MVMTVLAILFVLRRLGTTTPSEARDVHLTSILTWLGNLLGGPFAKAAVDADRAKLSVRNTAQRVAADLAARELAVEQRERELDIQSSVAEEGNWSTGRARADVGRTLGDLYVEDRCVDKASAGCD